MKQFLFGFAIAYFIDWILKSPAAKKNPVLSPEQAKAFTELADSQRGEPESAMIDIQSLHSGVLSFVIEHTGDLTHRMSERIAQRQTFGRLYVLDKVSKVLDVLESPYGFEKEHEENIMNNLPYRKISEQEYRSKLDELLKAYAKEHEKLKVYNQAQLLAKKAAVALGRKQFFKASEYLHKLKEWASDENTWLMKAGTFIRIKE